MVLQVMKWNIHPGKEEAYYSWTESAIKRTLSAPGVVEFRAYRPATGSSQIVTTYEFSDMAAWASWQSNEDVQKVLNELRTLALNIKIEVWGQSPVVPEPIRPGA
jgi:quinol monooxygenase YgiN